MGKRGPMWGERLASAGIMLAVTVVVVGIGWVVSIGFYEIGLWPLGALLRVGVWIFALFGLYWVIRHLLRSPTQRLMDQIDAMRERGELD